MTDNDDRRGFEPKASPDDAVDPAQAFEALRQTVEDLAGDLTREMTTIRKGVEAAFEEFERSPAADRIRPGPGPHRPAARRCR
ncbi:DUF6118 family protein [Mesorhizobium sp. M0276]|uniref:DUF6118 family protein n=1 Tax=Mesorhizobium sp. M0276 TaxID=2956928 RepID=UPI00333C68ED